MCRCRTRLQLLAGLVVTVIAAGCAAKAAKLATVVICGSSIDVSQQLPPTDIGAVVLMAVPCLQDQSGRAASIPDSFRKYVELQTSRPSDGFWVAYDERARETMQSDFRRLWESGRLKDLSINVTDYTFPNGVVGKFVTYAIQTNEPN